jgi:hypothetical protein
MKKLIFVSLLLAACGSGGPAPGTGPAGKNSGLQGNPDLGELDGFGTEEFAQRFLYLVKASGDREALAEELESKWKILCGRGGCLVQKR